MFVGGGWFACVLAAYEMLSKTSADVSRDMPIFSLPNTMPSKVMFSINEIDGNAVFENYLNYLKTVERIWKDIMLCAKNSSHSFFSLI